MSTTQTARDVSSASIVLDPHLERGREGGPRFGLLLPAGDRGCEADLASMARGSGIDLHVSRVGQACGKAKCCESSSALAGLSDRLDDAAALLPSGGGGLDVVGYACASGTAVSGLKKIAAKVHAVHPDAEVTTPLEAAIHALKSLEVERIAAVLPYRQDVAQLILSFLRVGGVETVSWACFGLDDDEDMGRIAPETLVEAVRHVDDPAAEAVLVLGTALRTADLVDELETSIGKPVVTSNQALWWHATSLMGGAEPVAGFGSLLSRPRPN